MTGKLDAGGVISRIFELYGRAAGVLLPAAAIIYLFVALLTGAALSGHGAGLALLAVLVGLVGELWYYGLVVEVVRELRVSGNLQPLGAIFESVRPRVGALFGIGLLAGLGIGLGLVLLLVPGLYLLTIWALIIPVLIIERGPAMDSFGRSRELVRGNGWQVFSVMVVVLFITILVQQAFRALGGHAFIGLFLTSLLPGILLAPLGGLAASIMYFDLRELRGELAPGEAPYGSPLSAPTPGSPIL